MVTRRNALIFGLAGPLLAACGGGGDAGPGEPRNPNDPDGEAVVRTTIPSDDWAMGTPESQGIASAAINAMMAGGDKMASLRSMLIIRNGVLVGERYFNNALASDLQHVRSVTKSVSSLLVGQAIRDGKLSGVGAVLGELLPAELAQVPNSVASNITLRRVLQMRSGLKFNDEISFNAMVKAPSLARYALALPTTSTSAWNYDSATSHLPSPIVAAAYGEANVLSVATRTLFAPLGIRQVAWERDPSGANYGSFGLQLRSRDMAKLGLMALDGGQWQGQSIVTSAWLAESMTNQALLGTEGEMIEVGYGYLWWSGILGGHRIWTAWGHGGQFIMLVPDVKVVVVSTSRWNIETGPAQSNARATTSLIAALLSTIS